MKKNIKLNETDLHKIIAESVNKVLKEWHDDNDDSSLGIDRSILDDAKNIQVTVGKAINEFNAGNWRNGKPEWLRNLYIYSLNYIEDYEKVFPRH